MPLPEQLVALLVDRRATIATAESLTGGAVCSALVTVPGASAAVRGGIVAYSAAMKSRLLGVDPDVIDAAGLVSSQVAQAMARGVREATGATYGLATTGVAGPEPHDGEPPGSVWLALDGPGVARSLHIAIPGDREAVRSGSVEAALALVITSLTGHDTSPSHS